MTSDAELIARVQQGDAAAFEALFRAQYDFLVAFAHGYVGSADVARDIVADVFVNVWSTRDRWVPTTSVRTYLCGAVRNRSLNALRDEQGRSSAVRGQVAAGSVPGFGEQDSQSPQERLEHEERIAVVWRAIEQLPANQREAMLLRWRQHLPFDEIAAIMGLSQAAVQMHLSRALKVLRTVCPAAFGGAEEAQ